MGEGQGQQEPGTIEEIPLTLADCEEKYEAQTFDTSVKTAICNQIEAKKQWGVKGWRKFFLDHIPAIKWLRNYRFREWIIVDVLAGITVGTMNIPQGMAYALLAMQFPVVGLYNSLFYPLIYAFFGTSKHVAIGVLAVVSLMTGSVVLKVAPDESISTNSSKIAFDLTPRNKSESNFWCGASDNIKTSVDHNFALEVAVVLSFMVAVVQLLLGFLRLGFLTVLLSDELLQGLTTGAGFHVFTSQVKDVFGIQSLPRPAGSFGIFKFWGCFTTKAYLIEWLPVTISSCCILVLLICKKIIDPRTQKTIKFPIPGELIIVIITTLISWKLNLEETKNLAVVGTIPHGIAAPEVPNLGKWFYVLIADAVSIAIVSYAIEVSVAKHFARVYGYEINANQISSWVNSLVVFLVLVTVASFLEQLPKCTLAAIIWVALLKLFMQIGNLPSLFRKSKTDFMIWVVTCVSVVVLDVKIGVAVGVGFAIFTFLFRFLCLFGRTEFDEHHRNEVICGNTPCYITPSAALLKRLEGTDYFDEGKSFGKMEDIERTVIIRFNSPVFYGNAMKFKEEIYRMTAIDPAVVRHKQDNLERKLAKTLAKEQKKSELENNNNGEIGELLNGTISDKTKDCLTTVMEQVGASCSHVIIDCSALCFVDIMGSRALAQVYNDFKEIGITVFFVNITASVRQMLSKCDFFETVRKRHVIPTLAYAVTLASHEQQEAGDNNRNT